MWVGSVRRCLVGGIFAERQRGERFRSLARLKLGAWHAISNDGSRVLSTTRGPFQRQLHKSVNDEYILCGIPYLGNCLFLSIHCGLGRNIFLFWTRIYRSFEHDVARMDFIEEGRPQCLNSFVGCACGASKL